MGAFVSCVLSNVFFFATGDKKKDMLFWTCMIVLAWSVENYEYDEFRMQLPNISIPFSERLWVE